MSGDQRMSMAVGSFALVALGAIVFGILSLGQESGLFTPRYRLIAHFDDVQGLLPGAPVWLAGTSVGSVEDVVFEPLGSRYPLRVVLRIDAAVKPRIRQDSIATIGTIGLLGDSYVDVTVGTHDTRELQGGEEIQASSPVNYNKLIARGGETLELFGSLVTNLDTIASQFAEEDGAGEIVRTVEQVRDVATGVGELIEEVRTGDGLFHSLVYDQYAGGGVKSIEHSLASLENIMHEIETGDGIFHTLIYESPSEQNVVLEMLQAGARLNSILSKIDRGEGTMGLLVNDPTLYDDLKILLGGAQKSTVVRSLINYAVEKEAQ